MPSATATAGLIALAALAACSNKPQPPPDDVYVVQVGDVPTDVAGGLMGTRLAVPIGIVIEIEVESSQADAGVAGVTVDDPSRVSVLPMVSPSRFVVLGVAPGSANLSVSIGGEQVAFTVDGTSVKSLPVDVTPMPTE